MLILLDSNVWRYIADADAAGALQSAVAKTRHRIVVAPAVLYEAIRMRDTRLRQRLAEIMTRPAWHRLMPDAYSECEELRSEVQRLRPEWLRERPDLGWYRRIRSDWKKANGGFWSRARHKPDIEHEYIGALDGETIERARANARRQRQGISDKNRPTLGKPLNTVIGRPPEPEVGWDGEAVEAWRLHAWSFMTSSLGEEGSAHHDWISGAVDLRLALFGAANWTRFWFYDVDAPHLPRMWLRWSMEFMQSFHKVTDGTPVDAQIASYATDVDLIVSADTRFIAMCERCRREAPFKVAEAIAVGGGEAGVEELFDLVRAR